MKHTSRQAQQGNGKPARRPRRRTPGKTTNFAAVGHEMPSLGDQQALMGMAAFEANQPS
jgi:hypothetical protein